MAIRLLIADDHLVVRTGLKSLVATTDIEVVGEASSGVECIRLAQELNPDVVLLDIRMPDGDGLNALSRLKLERAQLPVLVFSTYDNPTYVARAVALGGQRLRVEGLPVATSCWPRSTPWPRGKRLDA